MGTLFVIATPIGNLGDLSPRAAQCLVACALIVAEDTRRTSILARHVGSSSRMVSLNEHNVSRRLPEIMTALEEGDVALVSDAGTPAISDPGFQLVDGARDAGHNVVAIPGPSAVTAALSIAGVRATPFAFLGYAPRGAGERQTWLAEWMGRPIALVFFESPNRIVDTIASICAVAPRREVVLCRELTKQHEQSVKVAAEEIAAMLDDGRIPQRGEMAIVVEPAESIESSVNPEDVIRSALADGQSASYAAREAASVTGRPKSELYQLALAIKRAQSD
jgi:16S rRNA (cytidine1402-2'-O)-methyltransferase